ncbi:hypothetical protein GALMADRAFT_141453 [Galerina marginata CBS 339.88]|uniref:Caspase family p20 domain-containing protein n=1 Tax=Galerina marginata (strain CBS 339.88) TaxID=685588 RepID=A0A067SU49_GALM3|nr:hypothetical protein GALMADRAFT_141453 [Galerina marginata CBS 339.88]
MEVSATHLFGLLIGINTYKSNAFPSLRGAVADTRAIATYLQDQLNVPQDHLTILENESATREAIVRQLRCLATDPRIQRGTPIIIFYAGYGSETVAPVGWGVGDQRANIQLTLPYDACCNSGDEVVGPISDRTLSALLSAIAQEKGNNIVVIMDSCHSASGISAFNESSDFARYVPLPSDFQYLASQDAEIWSSFPTNGGLRSHILLSACGPFGQAWEADAGGVFTVALLTFLKDNHEQINKLRYCDIVMQMDIDRRQNPHCDGLNRERHIFTATSPPSIDYFIPAYTRTSKKGPFAYVMNGGAAHGLVIGDEIGIYPEMDYPIPVGTLVVDEVASFCSILRLTGNAIPIAGNAVAVRVKQAKHPPFRIYSCPQSKVLDIPSILRSSEDFSTFAVVSAPEECDIAVYVEDAHTVFQLRNIRGAQCFCIEPTAEELGRILKTSWQFVCELNRSVDFSNITQHVRAEMYQFTELTGAPTAEHLLWNPVPYDMDFFTLRQGCSYGLQLTNDSSYDLYPTVQIFDPRNEFKFETLYQPACTRFGLDAPLKKDGGYLTIAYSSATLSDVVPCSSRERHVFLKVSLFTRPLDPFYEGEIFRFARRLPETHKSPWATVTKRILYLYSGQNAHPLDGEGPTIDAVSLKQGLRNTNSRASDILNNDTEMSDQSPVTEPTPSSPGSPPIFPHDSKQGLSEEKNQDPTMHPIHESETKAPSDPEADDLRARTIDPRDDRSNAGLRSLLLRVFSIYFCIFIWIHYL